MVIQQIQHSFSATYEVNIMSSYIIVASYNVIAASSFRQRYAILASRLRYASNTLLSQY